MYVRSVSVYYMHTSNISNRATHAYMRTTHVGVLSFSILLIFIDCVVIVVCDIPTYCSSCQILSSIHRTVATCCFDERNKPIHERCEHTMRRASNLCQSHAHSLHSGVSVVSLVSISRIQSITDNRRDCYTRNANVSRSLFVCVMFGLRSVRKTATKTNKLNWCGGIQ